MIKFKELTCYECGKNICWCDEVYSGTEIYCNRCKKQIEKSKVSTGNLEEGK